MQQKKTTRDFPWFSLEQIDATPEKSRRDVALIAISSDHRDFAEPDGYAKILKLLFDDVRPKDIEAHGLAPGETVVLFSEDHANQILDFVVEARKQGLRTWIHCRMGISRSAAVSAALGTLFDDDGFEPFDRAWPNEHVYQVLMSVGKGRGISPFPIIVKQDDAA